MAMAFVDFDAIGFRRVADGHEIVAMKNGVIVYVGAIPIAEANLLDGDMIICRDILGTIPVQLDQNQEKPS